MAVRTLFRQSVGFTDGGVQVDDQPRVIVQRSWSGALCLTQAGDSRCTAHPTAGWRTVAGPEAGPVLCAGRVQEQLEPLWVDGASRPARCATGGGVVKAVGPTDRPMPPAWHHVCRRCWLAPGHRQRARRPSTSWGWLPSVRPCSVAGQNQPSIGYQTVVAAGIADR